MFKHILKSTIALSALTAFVPVANAQSGPMISNRFGGGVVFANNVSYYNNSITGYSLNQGLVFNSNGTINYQQMLRDQLMRSRDQAFQVPGRAGTSAAGNTINSNSGSNLVRTFPSVGTTTPLVVVGNPGTDFMRHMPADGTKIPHSFVGGSNLGTAMPQVISIGTGNFMRHMPADGTKIPHGFSRGAAIGRSK